MGALVTLDLPADAPALTLPWIITVGPMHDDEEWEPVVCGPYERAHALALAESVVADEALMAVVEPLQPYLSVQEIRGEIDAARLAAENEDLQTEALDEELAGYGDDPHDRPDGPTRPAEPPSAAEVRAGFARVAAQLVAR